MFSSLSKYSPKNLLASYLSLSLAQFFNVDPTLVETNLIQDAKVLLNDVEIKERRLGGNGSGAYLKVSGSIQQIEFSWVWDSAALIKDVRLTVRGVSIHVGVMQEDAQDAMLSGSNSSTNTMAEAVGDEDAACTNSNEAPSDWRAKYMQQIIDRLTLAVTDATIAVRLDEESQVAVLQAKGMELLTLTTEYSKEKFTAALMQTISLESIEAWVEQDDAESNKFPILEPFGYTANVTRLSGRRFLDGVLSGLCVKGESHDDSFEVSSTIRIHAGVRQIAGLTSLQQVLLLVGQENVGSKAFSLKEKSQDNDAAVSTESKSIFHLPVQSMEVMLENKTNLQLAGCNIRYSTDGSEFCVECSGGIWVDHKPLSKDSKWILDLLHSELLLTSLPAKDEFEGELFYSSHSGGDMAMETENQRLSHQEPFQLNLSLDMLQKIYHGIQAIAPQCTEVMKSIDQDTQPMSSPSSWAMRSSGPVSFRFTGKSKAWLEVVADTPRINQTSSGKGSVSFECKSTKVSSNSGFAIKIPNISTDEDGNIAIDHRVSATVDSMNTIKVIQNIFNDVIDVIGSESSASPSIPINIALAGFDISWKDSGASGAVHLSTVNGSGMEWSVGLLQVRYTGKSGAWIEAVADSLRLSQSLSAKGFISLECKSTKVSSNAGFDIQIPRISTDDGGNLTIEHRISATVDSMDTFKAMQTIANDVIDVIGTESSGSYSIPVDASIAGFDISIKDPQMSTVHLSRISGSGIEWSIGLLQVFDVENVTLHASALHVTLDAQKTIGSVQKIKQIAYDNVDYLATAIEETTFAIENSDVLSIGLKDVHFKYPNQLPESNARASRKLSLKISMSLHLTMDRLRAEPAGTGNFNIDSVDLWIRPTTTESIVVDLDIKSMKARLKDTVEVACGKINSSIDIGSACGDINDSVLFPGVSLSSASMTVHDITHLSSFAGHLNKPLDLIEITYGARTAMVKVDKVLFCTRPVDCPSQGNNSLGVKKHIVLPIAVYFEAKRFISMEEFGPGLPGLCCDDLQVHLTPSKTTMNISATCNYIQGRNKSQADLAAKSIKLNLRKFLDSEDEFLGLEEMELTMNEITTLSVPGKFKLVKPICKPLISWSLKDGVNVECDVIHVSQSPKQPLSREESEIVPESAEIPVPFRVTVDRVVIDSDSATTKVVCNQFSTQYLKSTSRSLHLQTMSVECKFETCSFKANGISVHTKWQGGEHHGHKIILPYLGSLSFAQVELDACTEMTTNTCSLIQPIHKPKLLFQQGFLVLEFADIELEITNVIDSSHEQEKIINLDVLNIPVGFNVSNRLRLKSNSYDILCENFGIDYVCPSSSPRGEVYIHCDRLVESAFISAKNMNLRLVLNPKGVEITDFVERASLTIDEMTSLYVNGKGHLSQPMQHTSISYKDNVLATDIQKVHLELFCSKKSQAFCLKGLTVRIQNPFGQTVGFASQISKITGNGGVASFSAADANLITTILRTKNEETLASKSLVIPTLGYASMIVLDVSELSSLSINNAGHLKTPVTNISLRFEKDIVTLGCSAPLFLQSGEKKKSLSASQDSMPTFYLPCTARISVGVVQVCDISQDQKVLNEISCRSLDLTLKPLKVAFGQSKESIRGPGIGLQLVVNDFKNIQGSTKSSTAVDVPRLSVSGLVQHDFSKVGNLAIGIEKAQLAAEFSSSNWSGSADTCADERASILSLPFASIPKFQLTLQYVGTLMNINDATIACDEFQGTAYTTLSQIKKHYAAIVTGRIPFLLSEAEIANCNIGDSMGVVAGKMITNTSVLGATVGVASRDVVGSALTMGKESRGASASDGYRFGDFSRGVASSVRLAAKAEADMREDNSYQLGDVTAGTAKAAGKYAADNKCRLAGAGGSAIGMGVGAALLGPVGFIAGSMIGGSAAKSSVAALTGADPKKRSQYSQEAPDFLSSDNPQRVAKEKSRCLQEVPDLLSSDSPHHVAQEAYSSNQVSSRSTQQNRQAADAIHYSAHQSHRVNNYTAPTATHQANNVTNNQQNYQFGDITRGIVARGKKADNRDDNSGYKFGDFTRGLFK